MATKNEQIKPVGTVTIKVYENGVLRETIKGNNLVVDGGRTGLALLLGGGGTGTKEVDTIGFGTDGTAEALTDTGLTGAYTKALDGVTYPAAKQVEFEWTLGTAENNGVTIREFGLFTTDGTLFARITHPGIAKTNVIELVGTWNVSF